MRLINQKVELIPQSKGLDGIYKQIELAGRTCYKSEDKITDTSARNFVERMISSKHYAMLEHGTVYLQSKSEYTNLYIHPEDGEDVLVNPLNKYYDNPYSNVDYSVDRDGNEFLHVTTNYRVLVEHNWLDDLKYLCEPTEYHEKRITIKFTCGIDISREFNRHRVNSMAEQSTRYCNYSKDKFGNTITYIIPSEFQDILEEGYYRVSDNDILYSKDITVDFCKLTLSEDVNVPIVEFLKVLEGSEYSYMRLVRNYGFKPQIARKVLPLNLATELVHTAFELDWGRFFYLRYYGVTGSPHPDAMLLASKARAELIKAGLWDSIMSGSFIYRTL